MNILSYNKLQSIKPCSQNNKALIEQLIKETETFKIQKLLGTCVYNKIVDEIKSGNISEELQSILDNGLYSCIAYAVYARYIQESMLVDTFTGMVTKNRQDSQTANVGALKNVANEYSDMSMYSFSLVKDAIMKKYGTTNSSVDLNKFSEIQGIRKKVGISSKKINITYL